MLFHLLDPTYLYTQTLRNECQPSKVDVNAGRINSSWILCSESILYTTNGPF